MNLNTQLDSGPWYRQPWPWLLMAGPASVVVAGFITLALAIESSDGLVADDYYKQGKAINKTLHRDEVAQSLGYQAVLTLAATDNRISLAFASATPNSAELNLLMAHSTRSGFDRNVVLTRQADGRYIAALPPLAPGQWQLILEDANRQWRLTGNWHAGDSQVQLGAAQR